MAKVTKTILTDARKQLDGGAVQTAPFLLRDGLTYCNFNRVYGGRQVAVWRPGRYPERNTRTYSPSEFEDLTVAALNKEVTKLLERHTQEVK